MKPASLVAASLTILVVATSVHAQTYETPRLSVSLRPIAAPAGHTEPVRHGDWRRVLEIRSNERQEVVRDRRLLRLTVRPEGSRQRLRCVHPDAPRRVDPSRVEEMPNGATHREWIDLRMYCTGRALRALESKSATVEVEYGFRTRSRTRYVAKRTDERRPPNKVAGTSMTWTAPAIPATAEGTEAPALAVTLSGRTTRGGPTFSVRARGAGRAYMRDDLWSFLVSGPLGDVVCAMPRTTIVPIVDFFRRLNRGSRASLSSSLYCPDDTFAVPGVYEIRPKLEFVYDGDQYEIEALTGTFIGDPAVFRVRGAGYVDQRIEDLFETEDADDTEPQS